jgi:hypothetical protein
VIETQRGEEPILYHFDFCFVNGREDPKPAR